MSNSYLHDVLNEQMIHVLEWIDEKWDNLPWKMKLVLW